MKSSGRPNRRSVRWLAAGALQLALAFALCARPEVAMAAPTFTVNNVFDVGADPADTDYSVCRTSASNSNCTLRAAIMKANHFAGGGVTINIPAGTYTITIPKGSPIDNDETKGDLNILQNLTINGAATPTTIVDGGGLDRVFQVKAGTTVTISNLTVQNAFASGGAIGGGIVSAGNLTLNNLHLTKNTTTSGGGLGSVESSAVLNFCTIDYNNAGSGGAIADISSTVTLNNCTLANNTAASQGGALYLQRGSSSDFVGIATLNNSSVSGNHALDGGGIHINVAAGSCTVTVNNSTINANLASNDGGGIYVDDNSSSSANNGVLVMNNSTLIANGAQHDGGGIYNLGKTSLFFTTVAGNVADSDSNGGSGGAISHHGGSAEIWNSLLAENYTNSVENDASNVLSVTSQDYNYVQSGSFALTGATAHNVYGGDVLLDGLQGNGGATATRALLVGSPALDHIPAALCRDSFGTAPIPDQRHVARPAGSNGDMGAFEGSIQPIYDRNLIRNGDAENGAGSPTGAKVGTPNWTLTGGAFTAVPYNAAGGYPNTTTDPVPAQHGFNFFSGGNTASTGANQTIDLSAIGTRIDTGNQAFTFSGDFGGFATETDAVGVDIVFLDSNHGQIGTTPSLGPYAPSDRGNVTGFKNHSTTGVLPVGTRYIFVEIEMIRSSGTADDAYLDNLSFVLAPPPTLGNISTRAFVQTGDNVMIGGFIVSGSGAKKVLVRAIGPSLSGAGIVNPLQNPTLELHDGTGALIAFNDNWGDAPNVVDITNSGLAPNNSLESAIFAILNPGLYTGVVQGLSNGTGIALIEAYDLDRTTLSKLGNISTRALVQPGDNVMIGGLIVRSPGSEDVVIRVIGPSLSSAGIPNPLADPVLELHDGNGALIAFNDNWKDTQQTQIQATGLAPSNNAEPAIVRTLAPGLYTAVVVGKNNTSGVALVEVYALN
jgi:hypothetical protein